MPRRYNKSPWILVALSLPLAWSGAGCEVAGPAILTEDAAPPPPDAEDLGPCGQDCSLLKTGTCLIGVCNTGQYPGTLNECAIVPSPKGTACDDGLFCTLGDACDGAAKCVAGGDNNCGIKPDPCSSIICYEELQKCDTVPAGDGTPCTPKNLCQVNGICTTGQCIGEPKSCAFSPLSECNSVTCDPNTGKCNGIPDPSKDNVPCVLTGDLCRVNKTCQTGECAGGEPKDCSALDVGCSLGACNSDSGLCGTVAAPVGTPCVPGTAECVIGACDTKRECKASAAPDGSSCNDFNACTSGDKCTAGVCGSTSPVASCSDYLHEGFENCSNGWTLGGDWQCGIPLNEGPPSAYVGQNLIGTQIAGLYTVNQSFNTAVADTPVIDLTMATSPRLSFWAWDHTEGGSFDGWNLKISENNGQTYVAIPAMAVTPPYPLNIIGQPSWGGDHSAKGWQNYTADLSAYAGKSVKVRFSFRSDAATVKPGVYIDEVVVAEPVQIPLVITTAPKLPDTYSGMSYTAQINRLGGSANALWSIKAGGMNSAWLTIDPMSGQLKGTPMPSDVGPVSFTVRVEEPMLPSNFAERAFSFAVKSNAFYTSFEDTCPAGWTLTGDWECGVPVPIPPMNLGPATAYIGTQCLATKLASLYSNMQTWAGTTATSPEIDLTNVASPTMTFRMWIDTEGSTYDGVNLKVSTDGGMTYSLVTGVAPTYPLTVAQQSAWGGHQAALGWQFMQADLSPFAGQKIRLQFALQTDNSGVFPGAYIDDIFINN